MIVETELTCTYSHQRRQGSTVCTGLGGIGWRCYGDDGCVVETYAFTEGDGVVCYLHQVSRVQMSIGDILPREQEGERGG
jgi:hypothetical protein